MTSWRDNILTGAPAVTSALSSLSPVRLSRTFRFTGGSGTQSFVFPTGVCNLNAVCYINANGSAATTDKITVSAAGTNLLSFTSMGSATGIVEVTTAALGTKTVIASACSVVTNTVTEVTAAVTLLSTDTAADYQVTLLFDRIRQNLISAP